MKLVQSIGLTLLSRLVGFLRLVVETSLLGLTNVTDAYQAAFRLTNFFREVFGEGAIGSVFTPMHAKCVESEGQQTAQKFFWCVIYATLIFSSILVLLIVFNLNELIELWMPDLPNESKQLVLKLSPIMLPYLVFIATASMFMVMHQIMGRFIYSSLHPIVFSFSIIAIGFWNPMTNYAESLAWGVLIGGICQLALLSFTLNLKWPKKIFFKGQLPRLKQLAKLLVPIILALIVHRTNRLIDLYFASGLPNGSLSSLAYAFVLLNVPMGLISAASNAVFYPIISRLKAEKKQQDYENAVQSNLNFLTLCGFWAMGLICFNALDLIELLFVKVPNLLGIATQFDARAAILMSESLRCYSVGLGFLILNPYLVRLYHSNLNTSFPAKVAVLMVALNFTLNWYLTPQFEHQGIALATSAVAIVYCIVLILYLNRFKYMAIQLLQISRWLLKLITSLVLFAICAHITLPFHPILKILLASLIYFGFWHLVKLKRSHVNNIFT